ncbi:polyA-binding protein interacting protein 2 [Rhynchophorus ferrugineus]|uniref:polyA-binding protein interacting protein 2 n=1 Tax=Rhynchophorus ferrugineus TaxID=354439 RepID=UPI003FCED3E2
MKMPPTADDSADNGIYHYEENSLKISAEEIENTAIEDLNEPPENDFSEYLWMENEEEFDKEVMQKLEEEALMEECMEAFMDDENTFQASEQMPPVEAVENSKLNPEAEEFVPLSRRVIPEDVSVSTSSS